VKKLRDQIGQAVLDIREAWKREGLDVERRYKVAVSTAPIRWTNACRGAVDRGTESSGGSSLGSGPCIHHAAEVMRTGDL